eukprot:CAMPEP_0179236068 /NCGR_PEP_ID=MMETSP0797-20121207/13735_1 /TAXON_ID=47934 /ORGANISM="Dinophysis acuminata, Strain DAEP01" /LENGTH=171 /DNA_ID=CAMNT_0020943309 /DNA_START=119 /DNA_END=630 /DNA_ORIENTATION=+
MVAVGHRLSSSPLLPVVSASLFAPLVGLHRDLHDGAVGELRVVQDHDGVLGRVRVQEVHKTEAFASAFGVQHRAHALRRDGAEGGEEPVQVDVPAAVGHAADVEGDLLGVVEAWAPRQGPRRLELLQDEVHVHRVLRAALAAPAALPGPPRRLGGALGAPRPLPELGLAGG